jgi:transcriptional regulator with XRE-family HTH domain
VKGVRLENKRLGALLRSAREEEGLSLAAAAQILGYHDRAHMHLAESGKIGFTAKKLERAIRLYGMKIADVIEASASDYKEALGNFFGKGKS